MKVKTKKQPKCEHLAWAESDATQHPDSSREGYFSSMDIIKIFPEIKMDALQEWFRRELVRPVYLSKGPTGWIKLFNRSGLAMCAIFKRLVDFGVPREHARSNMLRIHNERIIFFEKHNIEPDFIFLEKKGKYINKIEFKSGDIELDFAMDDAFIVNFHKILFQIDSYQK